MRVIAPRTVKIAESSWLLYKLLRFCAGKYPCQVHRITTRSILYPNFYPCRIVFVTFPGYREILYRSMPNMDIVNIEYIFQKTNDLILFIKLVKMYPQLLTDNLGHTLRAGREHILKYYLKIARPTMTLSLSSGKPLTPGTIKVLCNHDRNLVKKHKILYNTFWRGDTKTFRWVLKYRHIFKNDPDCIHPFDKYINFKKLLTHPRYYYYESSKFDYKNALDCVLILARRKYLYSVPSEFYYNAVEIGHIGFLEMGFLKWSNPSMVKPCVRHAITSGSSLVLEWFINNGVRMTFSNLPNSLLKDDIYAVGDFADTRDMYNHPVIIAVKHDQIHILELLLKYGSNVHHNNDEAICLASKIGNLDMVKLLLKHGAKLHANSNTPMTNARRYGHKELYVYLLEEQQSRQVVTDRQRQAKRCILKRPNQ